MGSFSSSSFFSGKTNLPETSSGLFSSLAKAGALPPVYFVSPKNPAAAICPRR